MKSLVRNDYIELVNMMPLVAIRSEAQYESSLAVLKKLAIKDAKMTRGELEYFEVLSLLVKRYEDEQFQLGHPSPQDVLLSLMQDHELTQVAVAEIADEYESNVSAFLAHKRNLTKQAACRLAAYFSVAPALFLR
jgi:HTH-type transcriptional regulator / antitoxin HigA